MKNAQPIEQQLIATGEGKGVNTAFVAQTMQKIAGVAAGDMFDSALRPDHRPSLWQRFKHLPRVAVAAIAFGACVLLSGTAYAAYTLWLSPTAQIRSVENKYGRDQALIALQNCTGSGSKVTIEITKGSKGTPEGAAASVLAHCELQAVQSWAMQGLHVDPSNVMFALVVQKITSSGIITTFSGSTTETTYAVPADAPVIFQGKAIRLSDLHMGDAVVIVTTGRRTAAKAVIKMSVPAMYYASDEVNNSYHDRNTCIGNAPASCISLPNLDVLRSGEGGANPDHHAEVGYEIQGKLISYTASNFVLEATDGKRYVVHTDSDVIGAFNGGNPYGKGIALEPGDVLMVLYEQPKDGDPKNIQSTQYHAVQLMLQGFSKKASTAENMQKYRY